MTSPLVFTPVVQIAGGLLLLLLGRRLFWLFVAVVGFFVGAQYGAGIFATPNDGVVLLAALALGALGAVLAVVLQRFAVTVAGAIAGGMMAIRIAPLLGLHTEAGVLAAAGAGALLAAGLLAVIFDPALIVISALTGAVMIAEALPIDHLLEPLVLISLALLGVYLQMRRRGAHVL